MTEKSKTEVCPRCNTPATNATTTVSLDNNNMAWREFTCNCGFLKTQKIATDEEGRGYVHD